MNYCSLNVKAIVCASPVVFYTIRLWMMVNSYGVDFPVWDDWSFCRVIAAKESHGWFGAVFEAAKLHNGHCLLLPKLLWLVMAECNGAWNLKLQMYATAAFGVGSATIMAVWIHARVEKIWEAALASLIASFFLLNFCQFQNWLWGFQTAWTMVTFFAIGGITLFQAGWRKVGLVICSLAMLCSGQGYMAVLALVVVLLWSRLRKTSLIATKRNRVLMTVQMLFIVILGLALLPAGKKLPDFINAAIGLMGASCVNPFIFRHFLWQADEIALVVAPIVGGLLLFGFLFLIPAIDDAENLSKSDEATMLPSWLVWFAVLNTLAIVNSRLALLGAHELYQSRYLTITNLLPLGCFLFLRSRMEIIRSSAGSILLIVGALIIIATIRETRESVRGLELLRSVNSSMKAAYMLWPATRVSPASKLFAPMCPWRGEFNPKDVDEKVSIASNHRLFKWKFFSEKVVDSNRILKKKTLGNIDKMERVGNAVLISGWSASAITGHPCDLIVPLIWRGPEFELPKTYEFDSFNQPSAIQLQPHLATGNYGWTIKFDTADLQEGGFEGLIILGELDSKSGKIIIKDGLNQSLKIFGTSVALGPEI